MASQAQYLEHQRQMAWINTENWQFEQLEKRYPLRQAMAKALLALASILTPATRRETQTAA
jgi:hypothetical protein